MQVYCHLFRNMLNFDEIRWYAVSLFVFAANVSKETRVTCTAGSALCMLRIIKMWSQ